MMCLTWSFQLQCVDVLIEVHRPQVGDNANSKLQKAQCEPTDVFDESDVDDEEDLLAKFCPHVDKVSSLSPSRLLIQRTPQTGHGSWDISQMLSTVTGPLRSYLTDMQAYWNQYPSNFPQPTTHSAYNICNVTCSISYNMLTLHIELEC
ncbi:hypothetical protein ACSBR1_026994 [Camellia fascicularis]